MVSRGLMAGIGMDMSRRIGTADIAQLDDGDPAGLHGGNALDYMMTSALGPFYSGVRDFVRGYDMIAREGRWLDGSIAMMPKAVKDGLKAAKLASKGAQTGAGKTVIQPDNIDIVDVAFQLFGVQPARISSIMSEERAVKNLGVRITERRTALVRNMMSALESDNQARIERAMKDIEKFNQSTPMFALQRSDFSRAATALVGKQLGIDSRRELKVRETYGLN